MKVAQFGPRFVESVPETLEPGVLYVSMTLASAIHLCACGCGREVVTPLSPTDWQLCFDGENISLDPSIGNWSFPCRSHYWIRGGEVRWSVPWSDEEIANGRARDCGRKNAYYSQRHTEQGSSQSGVPAASDQSKDQPQPPSWCERLWCRLTSRR